MSNIWQRIATSLFTKRVLSIILTMIVVVFLLAQISLRDVVDLLANISYRWMAIGGLFYFITNVGRALRLQMLLPNQVTRFHKLLPVVIAQSMFNNVLPARAGELSLVYLLRKHEAVPLGQGGVALIVARISDYLAVAAIFIVAALLSLESLPQHANGIIWIVMGVMLLTVVMLPVLAWGGRPGLFIMQRMFDWFGLTSHRAVKFSVAKLHEAIKAFEAIHSRGRYLSIFIWSLCIWGTTFAWFYAFLRGIGIQTAPLKTIVGATFAVLSKAIPFISVGGLGAHEAGWTIGFVLVGLDKTVAISSGFAVNILTLLTSIVMGGAALWILRAGPSIKSASELQTLAEAPEDTLAGKAEVKTTTKIKVP
jgi:uncharacterized protein (TIRG00374 family)